MPLRRVVTTTDPLVDDVVVDRSYLRQVWSPAQAVAVTMGFLFAILGAIAMARTGLNFGTPSAQHAAVAGFHHTALLGLIEFIVGLFLIGAGAVPGAGRESMTFFGVLLFGFGVVVMAEPEAFHRALATHSGHGLLYAVMGVALLPAAMTSPIFVDRTRRRRLSTTDVVERRESVSTR